GCWAAMNCLASSAFMTRSSVEPGAAAHLILVHDRAGVAVREAVLVGQPVRALLAAEERGTGLEASEPLREVATRNIRDAGDQVLVQLRRVVQGQLAPPGWTSLGARLPYARLPDNPRARPFLITRYQTVISRGLS